MSHERALIGLCLRSAKNYETALSYGVRAEHFSEADCIAAWAALSAAEALGLAPEFSSVSRRADPSMLPLLGQLMAQAPISLSAAHFAAVVRRLAWQREAMGKLVILSAAVQSLKPEDAQDDVLTLMRETYEALASSHAGDDSAVRHLREVLDPWLEDTERRVLGKVASGIPTGFRVLDIVFNGGWNRGGLYTIGARPGRGKTTFGVSTAIAAAESGATTLFATVEMSSHDITTKIVSNSAQVVGGRFQSGKLTDGDMDAIQVSVPKLAGLPLYLDDSWRGDLDALVTHAQRVKRRVGLDLLVVDYIGLVRIKGRFDSNRDRMAEISRRLKLLARDMNIALVVLAQLNRDAEEFDIPTLAHIAESDSIGRDSDGAVLIYRNDQDESFLSIAKNRWGREVVVPVEADLSRNAFKSVELNWRAFED